MILSRMTPFSNSFGELGNGTTNGCTRPVAVAGGLRFAEIGTRPKPSYSTPRPNGQLRRRLRLGPI
jgi:hypothetical protein